MSNPVTVSNDKEQDRWSLIAREILAGSPLRTLLAVLIGFVVGAIFMVAFDQDVLDAFAYFGSRPTDALAAMAQTIADGYGALFNGAIYNTHAADFSSAIRPITETLRLSAPLIMAGLGVGLGFRVGLFNIGGEGQAVMGGLGAGLVALAWSAQLPAAVMLPQATTRANRIRSSAAAGAGMAWPGRRWAWR